MTVLVGKQGRFKSTILSIMGGAWFSDSLRTFEGKEAEERLRGVWIIEVSELQAFDRSSVEAIKGFLSKQTDRYRPAYGHMLREFPRQCVFFGTTNTPDFLRDTTGGRRFWPIDIDERERIKSVVDDLPNERDQIWAEAVTRYKAGEPLYLVGEAEQTALQIQENHRELDPWEGVLREYLAKPIPADWDEWPLDRRRDFLAGQVHPGGETPLTLVRRERVSATEFLCEALGFAPGNVNQRDSTRVSKLLRGLLGWKPLKMRYRISYAQVRGYIRE
jgi:predicted P-loop ATPase